MLQTVRSENVDAKMRLFFQFPCSIPEIWPLNFLKKSIFCNFFADLSKKSKSFKTIYIYTSERSC